MAQILVVDDEVGIRELLSEILTDEGHDVVLAENATRARAVRAAQRPDLVLLDIWMPDTDGITLLKEWSAGGQLSMPVIMMSGHGSIDTAVEATRCGAMDFLEKPIALQKLLAAVKRGLARQPVSVPTHLTLDAFVRCPPLKDLKKRIEQVAARTPLLLIKSGPGSIAELAARSLQAPDRAWIDLGAHTSPLDVSALESASGGVLFAAELAQLSRLQQKNLAFAVERMDKFGMRIVVASAHGAEELAADGWDEALLRRLFEVSLAPPTLTDLRDEIPEIASQILQHLAESGEVPPRRASTAALNALRTRAWPGGYAELRASIKSLALGALDEEIGAEEVAQLLHQAPATAGSLALDLPLREAREAFERLYFEHHLHQEAGNMTRLAERTGLERTHLYRKLKQLGLQGGRRSDDSH
jgi:DNA-binding NtrC family response regulator